MSTVYIRFDEAGPSATMVAGLDQNDQERLIWLDKDMYIGEISMSGTVLISGGISQPAVIDILKQKAINEASIKKMYIAPYVKDQILWYVLSEQEGKKYNYGLDFFTGEIVIENICSNGS